MIKYAQVIINIPGIDEVFDYHIPEELQKDLEVGALVQVPFGRQTVQGFIHKFVANPQIQKTKPVESVIDPHAVLTADQQKLAEWLATETITPIALCYKMMLPPGLSQQADSLYMLTQKKIEKPLSPLQKRIFTALSKRGPLRGAQLNRAFSRVNWKSAIRQLQFQGIVRSEPYLAEPKLKVKTERYYRLNIPASEIENRLLEIGRKGSAYERRERILQMLVNQEMGVPSTLILSVTGANSADIKKLLDANLMTYSNQEVIRDPLDAIEPIVHDQPQLTPDQQSIWDYLEKLTDNGSEKPVLIHGVTGSGKTEIYLRLVRKILAESKTAIILVPEISLTPQTVKRFHARFPGKVGIIHSRLSEGERYDTWRRIRTGELKVVVGPRSALFSPLKNLGVIILDEAHDDSYFQDDIQPRYNAISAAGKLASLTNALLVFGSATPGVDMMFTAKQHSWHLLKMPLRVYAHAGVVRRTSSEITDNRIGDLQSLPLPPVRIVDMREELKQGNRSIFSRELHQQLKMTMEAGHQAILFLNRRGSATYVFCRNCGSRLSCPKCDIPLTFHASMEHLLCHHCGYKRLMPKKCPFCGDHQIRQFGIGTERVEEEVKKNFPHTRIIRLDSGITTKKNIHEELLNQFANREADILIGTQMLAKGIDFPFVTFVGAILADVGLSFPDYRSSERTFQLLTQVAGRAGRSPLGGSVIFQTYLPEEYSIRMAAKHDYEGFYHQELAYRKRLHYPPYTRFVRLEFRSNDPVTVEEDARKMAEKISFWIQSGNFKQTDYIGPSPCFFAKINSIYRWQIILRGANPVEVIRNHEMGDVMITVNPVSVL